VELLRYFLQFGIAFLGLIGGLFAYILGLRIRHDILLNNERIEKEISTVKDSISTSVNALRVELTKEFGNNLIRQEDRNERIDKEIADIVGTLTDRILAVVNGKYIRTEFYNQGMSGMQDRFSTMKELIEYNMEKIEAGLDRQIVDLKDRLFHPHDK
jgi:hypothetical protein